MMPLDFDNPRDDPAFAFVPRPSRQPIRLRGKAAKIAKKAIQEAIVEVVVDDRALNMRSTSRREIQDLLDGKVRTDWRR
jgi:hypothetical protein